MKLVVLCHYKLHMKWTTSLYSEIQQYKVHEIFVFHVFFRNLKEEDHIKRNINSKKRNVCIGNQYYYYFDLPKIRVCRAGTTKN